MEALSTVSNILMGFWPVITSLFGLFTAILGLYARTLKMQIADVKTDLATEMEARELTDKKLDALKTAFTDYKLEIAKTYMPAVDVKGMVDELKAYLIRIEDKVDERKS